ncbi:acetyltransferase (GNAT) family protein [Paenibacillus cellulosilyticus]|uniref:Acetyltransferase (GNAT) family protein n=1 Tax=Paenibacillus cellulosilyticus TaxID=375489 RepID=A0A2V2YWH1_9BACL|nr:GNAT family N-acetyltransferase [Paenibacillus cellulosilyticus]PWW05726.1 acetyltransferase (GNAT) family protein [Paenibacillus cellulosilyticus]QKS45259.1 GNAT family N-acetyltransferase [Paenibacillus cellulosilyticus]
MNELTIQICTDEDLGLLATLNKQLIEDEQHDNAMDMEQLRDRMRMFIHSDYTAYKFVQQDHVVGYALVNRTRQPLYLRQFYICRDFRRSGYGKMAFQKLLEALDTNQLDIEVMHWNHVGQSFWRSLGFQERSIYMRLDG